MGEAAISINWSPSVDASVPLFLVGTEFRPARLSCRRCSVRCHPRGRSQHTLRVRGKVPSSELILDNNSIVPLVRDELSVTDTATASMRHVLVVDDDPGMRGMLEQVLRGAGYRVSSAADGEAGWDALCAGSYDALITDHDMPRLTGLELLQRVRAGPLRLPTIFISGRMPSPESDLAHLLPPGVALEKPFSMHELLAAVEGIFGGSPRVIRGGQGRAENGTDCRVHPEGLFSISRKSSGFAFPLLPSVDRVGFVGSKASVGKHPIPEVRWSL